MHLPIPAQPGGGESEPASPEIEMMASIGSVDGQADDQPEKTSTTEDDQPLSPEPADAAAVVVTTRGPETHEWAPCRAYVTVFVLFLINLLNYMDRFTVSAVLLQIQDYYHINDSEAGLLQTAFICSYMILSPIFGAMGDRYSRKAIMTVGIILWSAVTLAGSFVDRDHFWLFLLFRALVGVGEASYSTIAPTILADLFVKDQRSNMLAIFYFAIPVGSGLGYIIGSNVAKAFGDWKYALRVTPGFGILCVILIVFLVREPRRGEAEGSGNLVATSWFADLKHLARNRSFILTTLGFTCVAFVAGALSFWAPTFVTQSIRVQQVAAEEADVALIFGIITCAAGFLGVALGSQTAKFMRRYNPRSDPLVCANGMLLCTPFLFLALVFSQYNTPLMWFLIFVGETLLCLNWSVVADIVLYVVVPTRRSTAEAFQILFSHALGDAGSPYLVGVISDSVKAAYAHRSTTLSSFVSLQYALYSTTFACVLGGGFFLATALFVQEDQHRVTMITKKAAALAAAGANGEPATADGIENEGLDESHGDMNSLVPGTSVA